MIVTVFRREKQLRRISLKDLGTVHSCLVEFWVRGCNSQAVNMALIPETLTGSPTEEASRTHLF